jgi:hypothetical protein
VESWFRLWRGELTPPITSCAKISISNDVSGRSSRGAVKGKRQKNDSAQHGGSQTKYTRSIRLSPPTHLKSHIMTAAEPVGAAVNGTRKYSMLQHFF